MGIIISFSSKGSGVEDNIFRKCMRFIGFKVLGSGVFCLLRNSVPVQCTDFFSVWFFFFIA
jgi:hypothetical protein